MDVWYNVKQAPGRHLCEEKASASLPVREGSPWPCYWPSMWTEALCWMLPNWRGNSGVPHWPLTLIDPCYNQKNNKLLIKCLLQNIWVADRVPWCGTIPPPHLCDWSGKGVSKPKETADEHVLRQMQIMWHLKTTAREVPAHKLQVVADTLKGRCPWDCSTGGFVNKMLGSAPWVYVMRMVVAARGDWIAHTVRTQIPFQ